MSAGLQSDLSLAKDKVDCVDVSTSKKELMAQWNSVVDVFRKELNEHSALTWLEALIPYEVSDMMIIMSAPTRFARDSVKSKYYDILLKAWQQQLPHIVKLDIIVGRQKKVQMPMTSETNISNTNFISRKRHDEIELSRLPLLNSVATETHSDNITNKIDEPEISVHQPQADIFDEKYTFENFVVGPSNELAFAAARKVAEGKGVTFNPLFFHGGVGLGKTHLMHAIALYMAENLPHKSVIYLSAEQFMHRFVVALRNKDTQTFKEQFRTLDVLMIDDLQFIAGKTQTQEEFFHTFNALVDTKKQVILSADRSPNDMGNMEERIRSRLSWGLVVDIHQTDYSLRIGILKSKIELLQKEYPTFFVPDKVIEFLAHCITGNVRELEGAINRIAAHATFTGRPVTLELTEDVIADLLRMYEKKTGVHEIRKRVSDYFGVKLTDLDSSRRSRDIAYPRQVAMYLTKSMTGMSYPEIGRKFGGKDHSTVIHAVQKIELAMNENNDVAEQIKELKKLLKTGS